MFGLVLSALRARRAQTVALFGLTVLAALGAAAAPWFLGWSRDAVAGADIASAPVVERVVSAGGAARYAAGDPSPADQLRTLLADSIAVPGAQLVVGEQLYATMARAGSAQDAQSAGLYLGYRDDICAHLTVRGACPAPRGGVVVSSETANRLGLVLGDRVTFTGFRLSATAELTISGLYEIADVASDYWAGADPLAAPVGVGATVSDAPAFTSEATLLGSGPTGLDLDAHLLLPPTAFHPGVGSPTSRQERVLAEAAPALRARGLDLVTSAPDLIDRIRRDQALASAGIVVAATQLLLLCWFALFLAVRQTCDERRPDIGLLKLRGAPAWRTWALTAQQSGWPMLAGTVVGWLLGYLAAAVLAGGALAPLRTVDSDAAATLRLSLAAAGLACLGALVAAVAAEWSVLRSSVATLLRQVPGRRRTRRAELVDLTIVVLAVAGVYQGHAELADRGLTGGPSVFALLAPGLVGLAVALVVARLLPALATRAGGAAIRSGHPGVALSALHLGRRPGAHRLFAVLAVAVAVFTTCAFLSHAATVSWAQRAAQELGAPRVLTVRAANSTTLLTAVRAADPAGRYAMAVARTTGVRDESRVLAVDATRLAAVAQFPPSYQAGGAAQLAALVRPGGPAPPVVVDGPITLDAQGPPRPDPQRPITLRLHLGRADGTAATVDFGPIGAGRASYPGTVTGCPPPAGCRVVALEPLLRFGGSNPSQSTVELFRLAQPGGDVVGPAVFADVTRWRAQAGAVGVGNVIAAGAGRLALTPSTDPAPNQTIDNRVFVLAAPSPLPVVLAGDRPTPRRPGDERIVLLGADLVGFQVVGTAAVLPSLGGRGVLVDLESAQWTVSRPGESAALQVWLTADAPAGVIAAIRAGGVDVLAETDLADVVDRLGAQGPGVVLRFEIFAALVVLLLAAGTLIVTATMERQSRVDELRSLRTQGLTDVSMAVAGYGGTMALVLGAIGTGVLAAVVAQVVVTAAAPVFADGWSLLPTPAGPAWSTVGTTLAAVLVVLGVAAFVGATRVVFAALVPGQSQGQSQSQHGGGTGDQTAGGAS